MGWESYVFLILVCAFIALVMAIYAIFTETIPYAKRTHLMLLPRSLEIKLGYMLFKNSREGNKGKIVHKEAELSIRAKLITGKLMEAMEKGLRDDRVWGVGPVYALSTWKLAFKRLLFGQHSVNESRAAEYLDHMKDWEVIVVYDHRMSAICFAGGKVVAYSGLFHSFDSDDEVAFVIAHEIAHAMARHAIEWKHKWAWIFFTRMWLHKFNIKVAIEKIHHHPLYLSLRRESELEADYLGLMLMASAGYDPRTARKVIEKLKCKNVNIESESTHPSRERRDQMIAQAQEEAMVFYKESTYLTSSWIIDIDKV